MFTTDKLKKETVMIDPLAHKAAWQVLNHKIERISVWKYYLIGKELFYYKKQYHSDKIFGQNLKLEYPTIAQIPAATRSNCIWLYRALEKEIACDLLPTLGVKRIEDLHTSNPSVIRHLYRCRKQPKNVLGY